MRKPRSFRYFLTHWPRALSARSASERYLPGEEPAGQRIIGDHAEARLAAERPQLLLEPGPLAEVVLRLEALVGRGGRCPG